MGGIISRRLRRLIGDNVGRRSAIRLRRRLVGGLDRYIVGRCQRARGHLRIGFCDRHRHLHVCAGHAIADHDRMLGTNRPRRRQFNVGAKRAGGRHFGDAPSSLIAEDRRGNPGGKGDAIGANFLPIVERDNDKAARALRTRAPAGTLHMQRRTDRDDRRNDDRRTLVSDGVTLSGHAGNSVNTVCGLSSNEDPTDDRSRRGQSQQGHAQSPTVRSHLCRHLYPSLS